MSCASQALTVTATQSLYAAVTVSAWEAQLIELLRRSRQQE